MSKTVPLEVPEQIIQSAHQVAIRTQRRLEDVLLEWLDQSATQVPIDYLSDEQVLEVANQQLPADLQNEMSALLVKNREGDLAPDEQLRLDGLMQRYRQGLTRKAEATKVAVERKLMPPLS